MKDRIRVMVVEDDPLMRIAVRLQLEKLKHVHVIASTTDGSDALRLVDTLQPDLVVGESRSGHAPAFAAHLQGLCPNARLILLTDEARGDDQASCNLEEGHVAKTELCRQLRAQIERMFGPRNTTEASSF